MTWPPLAAGSRTLGYRTRLLMIIRNAGNTALLTRRTPQVSDMRVLMIIRNLQGL